MILWVTKRYNLVQCTVLISFILFVGCNYVIKPKENSDTIEIEAVNGVGYKLDTVYYGSSYEKSMKFITDVESDEKISMNISFQNESDGTLFLIYRNLNGKMKIHHFTYCTSGKCSKKKYSLVLKENLVFVK